MNKGTMFDQNDNFKQKRRDFETKLHSRDNQNKKKVKGSSRQVKRKLPGAFFLALAIIVILFILGGIISFTFREHPRSAQLSFLTTNTSDIPSFDDYQNSNIGINFRYPHLWQVYDNPSQIIIANCEAAGRDICRDSGDGVRVTIEQAQIMKPGPSFQFKKNTEKGNVLSVDSSAYYVGNTDGTKVFRIEQTGLPDADRDPILDRIFDSIVIN